MADPGTRHDDEDDQDWYDFERSGTRGVSRSTKTLKESLNADFCVHETYLRDAIAKGMSMSKDAHARIQYVLHDADFRRWLFGEQSRIIVIDDATRVQSNTFSPNSELTHYAAALWLWTDTLENSVSLSFLCGYHRANLISTKSSEKVLIGFLRSLCAQILGNKKMNSVMSFSLTAEQVKKVKAGDIDELLKLFRLLVSELLAEGFRLVCLIDSANYLASEGGFDFRKFLRTLQQLVDDVNNSSDHGELKFVFTYPARWSPTWSLNPSVKSLSNSMVHGSELKLDKTGMTYHQGLTELLQ
jgi:hypothetical protein